MINENITQEFIGGKVGVSQATVCRALKARGGKVGPAQAKLFNYAGLDEYLISKTNSPRELVLNAFDQSWNGTKAHAETIAKVIAAMADLGSQNRSNRT